MHLIIRNNHFRNSHFDAKVHFISDSTKEKAKNLGSPA